MADSVNSFSHHIFLVMASGKKGVHPPWTEIVASPSSFLDPHSLPPEALAPGSTLVFDNPGTISNAYLELWVRHIRKLQLRYLMGESNAETFRWKSYSPGKGKEPVPAMYNETWMKGYIADWASVVTHDELQSLLGSTAPGAPAAKTCLQQDTTSLPSEPVASTVSPQSVAATPQVSTPGPPDSTYVSAATTIATPSTITSLPQNASIITPSTMPSTTTTPSTPIASNPPPTTLPAQSTKPTLPPIAITPAPVLASAQSSVRNDVPTPSAVAETRSDDVQDVETSQFLQGGGDDEIGGTVPGSSQAGENDHSTPVRTHYDQNTNSGLESGNGNDPANTASALSDSDPHNASSDEEDDLADMIARIKEKEALKHQAAQLHHISPSAVGTLPSEKLRFLSLLASDPQYQKLLNWFREQQVSTSSILCLHWLIYQQFSHS